MMGFLALTGLIYLHRVSKRDLGDYIVRTL